MTPLDDVERWESVRRTILTKPALRALYLETYGKYAKVLDQCPKRGLCVEIGAGASFAKDHIPSLLGCDMLRYPGLDLVLDARKMPFIDASLRAILMTNVFHHIPDVGTFLAEAQRCLVPGGRIFMVDMYPGWIGSFIQRYVHHEPFNPRADSWAFESTGPLSGANTALAWIVFERDRDRFESRFPNLRLIRFNQHTPLRYWLTGGLTTRWSALPGILFSAATWLDNALVRLSPKLSSFVDIELVKESASG